MTIRNTLVGCTAVCMVLVSLSSFASWWPFSKNSDKNANAANATELVWDDLIPDDFQPPENPLMTMSQEEIDKLMDGSEESNARLTELEDAFYYAPVVDNLDGKRIKIPAYITPLEFNGQSKLKEFLLVPYVGACIHVPPPPANQIVHAKSPVAIKIPDMYEPVWATGVIKAETIHSDLAESGYRLDVEKIERYEQ